jgi:hypothetical protein
MSNFFLILVVILFIVGIKKLFARTVNHSKENEKTCGQITQNKKAIRQTARNKKISEQIIPQTKNKWLYPTNEFGKLEEGVVIDSNTYKTAKPEVTIQQENFNIK